jgi:hypothetical protein
MNKLASLRHFSVKKSWIHFLLGKAMNLIEELKAKVTMEIRPTSHGAEYLEAVVTLKELDVLHSLLNKHIGPATKKSGGEVFFPKDIKELVDSLGGLRIEQSFFYKQKGGEVIYAAIWPWQSDPDKVTLKSGVSKMVSKA